MKLIGIDGGGTKTQLVFCREDGTVLRQLKTGPSNPNDIGLENSFQLLFQNIRQLSQGERECALFAGISGISTVNRQKEFVQALKDEFPDYQVDCAGDMVTALSSGILHRDGAVIIAGTGVIGYGRKQGKIYRVGGYGYLLVQAEGAST